MYVHSVNIDFEGGSALRLLWTSGPCRSFKFLPLWGSLFISVRCRDVQHHMQHLHTSVFQNAFTPAQTAAPVTNSELSSSNGLPSAPDFCPSNMRNPQSESEIPSLEYFRHLGKHKLPSAWAGLLAADLTQANAMPSSPDAATAKCCSISSG